MSKQSQQHTIPALVKAEAKEGVWLEQMPMPKPKANEVLIRVHNTAICGTDIHIYNWDEWAAKTIPTPMIIGHEFCGEVAELGSAVTGWNIGQRVSGEGHIVCGSCRNCRAGRHHLCINTKGLGVNTSGVFAPYFTIPAHNLYPLPDELPNQIASILDPLGNACHTALSFNTVGEDILITGAGPIGCMAAAICMHIGARNVVITDVNPDRLALAKSLNIKHCLNPATTDIEEYCKKEFDMKEGFDVGLETSGAGNALKQQVHSIRNGGCLALLGIPPSDVSIDWADVVFKGLTIQGIYGRKMYETWYKMVAMLQSGLNIEPIITHELPYYEFQKGFDLMRSGKSGKVILNWAEA